jgi:hypothetical protein
MNMNKTTMIRFLNSLNKLEDYKKEYRSKSKLSLYLNDVLIGLLLSDGHLERSSPTSAVRLSVSFGAKHSLYLLHLYDLFEPYTNTGPVSVCVNNKKTQTKHEVLKFNTVSLPQLLFYYKLFYNLTDSVGSQGKLIKIVPVNIEELMTPVVLAHLLMGDGNLKLPDQILRIYTNSFTREEVELLALAITKKLSIITKVVHDRNNQYIITISRNQLPLVIELIKIHMHSSMYYKLGLPSAPCSDPFNYKDIPELNVFSSDCYNYKDILKKKDSSSAERAG